MTRDAASRGVLLLTWQEVLRLPDLEALRCSALIVVLPSTEETARAHESKESTGALSFWHTMKQRMLATEWTIPVYFVEADAPRVQDMISSSANNDATKAKGKVDLGPLLRGSFRLKVEAEQPSAHTALTAPALHMHLRGTTDDDAWSF